MEEYIENELNRYYNFSITVEYEDLRCYIIKLNIPYNNSDISMEINYKWDANYTLEDNIKTIKFYINEYILNIIKKKENK